MDIPNKNLWPGWETVGVIGSGSYATVYEIRRKILDKEEIAALKMISIPQRASDIAEMVNEGYDQQSLQSTFEEHLKSILMEYSLMRKMDGSPNIVRCDDVRYERHADGIGWDIFIKMEMLTPLTKALPVGTPVDEATVIAIAKDMCSALMQCNENGIIHRDIKPQNIFVSRNGYYKLGDFGIAKTVDKTLGGTRTGTYKYMAPEIYQNCTYGSGVDIYALGLTLYFLLNEHRMPFLPPYPEAITPADEHVAWTLRLQGKPLPMPKNGCQELKNIILKACAFDPKYRYQSATEMYTALANVEAQRGYDKRPARPEYNAAPVAMFSAEAPRSYSKSAVILERKEATDANFDGALNTHAPVSERNWANDDNRNEDLAGEAVSLEDTLVPAWAELLPRTTKKEPKEPPKKAPRKRFIGIALAVLALLLLLKNCGSWFEPEYTEPDWDSEGQGFLSDTNSAEESENPQSTTPLVTEPVVTEPPKIAVPDMLKKAQDVAKTELENLGFVVELQYKEYENVPAGCVAEQTPQMGAQMQKGDTIILKICSGQPTISVMNVVGKTRAEAESNLTGQGFRVSFVEAYSTNVAKGKVVSQSPSAGSGQLSGTTIKVVISKGPEAVKIVFDAKGGKASESNRTANAGTKIGNLPSASRTGCSFGGWYYANGKKVASGDLVSGGNTLTVYAKWIPNAYSIKWTTGTGYGITVKRTSTLKEGAKTGTLKSGDAIYHGDVLSVSYTTATGYKLVSKGKTSITVSKDVTTSDIYATVAVNSFKVSWKTGTGYTISVKRTSSPKANAKTGILKNGDAIYYGDVLSVTYIASAGYSIKSKGATAITVSKDVTSSDIYATAAASSSFTVSWKTSTGYTAKVKRTKSSEGGSIGELSNGATIYRGDVLSITYTAKTGYKIVGTGKTSITVSGNVTERDIYATISPVSVTYKIICKSSNGITLRQSQVTHDYGTTHSVSAPSISGYTTPAAQTVKWDTTSQKTITFTYVPISEPATSKSGYISNSTYYKLAYSAKIEHRNRTATSVQIRITWTATLSGNEAYNAYGQRFSANVGSVGTGAVTVSSYGTWKNPSSSSRSKTASSAWITVPLNTTNPTTVSLSVYYYQVNSNGTDMTKGYGTDSLKATWNVKIPAY